MTKSRKENENGRFRTLLRHREYEQNRIIKLISGQQHFPAFVLKHKVGKCYNSGHVSAVSTFGLPGSLE